MTANEMTAEEIQAAIEAKYAALQKEVTDACTAVVLAQRRVKAARAALAAAPRLHVPKKYPNRKRSAQEALPAVIEALGRVADAELQDRLDGVG